jgi:Cdc6-like AAA superfamily ATPase
MAHFQYAPVTQRRIVVTDTIELAASRILIVHEMRGQFALMAGRSGAGKTTAATHICSALTEDCDNKAPNAFRARQYVSSDMRAVRADMIERRLLAEFLGKALDISVPVDSRRQSPAMLSSQILVALKQRNIQMVFIDEAGLVPSLGLNVLANLMNEACLKHHFPLTIVLVGMNDLPLTAYELPQVRRRIGDTICFEPYTAADALVVLREVDPYFSSLQTRPAEHDEVMEFLMSPEVSDGGMLGQMIQLVERASKFAKVQGHTPSITALRTAHLIKAKDAQRAATDARQGYRGPQGNTRGGQLNPPGHLEDASASSSGESPRSPIRGASRAKGTKPKRQRRYDV